MKRKVKRKYTRHDKTTEPKPDAPQLNSRPVEGESSVIVSTGSSGGKTIVYNSDKTVIRQIDSEFSFNDLPLSIRMQIENIIKMRARLHLPDDSKERKLLAIKYFRGSRPR